jgi:beta-ketodecanoyl-[acyl-carrier-protein] synthase
MEDSIVLSGTGYFVPEDSVSTEEIVQAFNQHIQEKNRNSGLPLGEDFEKRLEHSCPEFIVKASGIKNRRVIDKKGILNPSVMRPMISKRKHGEMSLQCEMSLKAAQEALKYANKKACEIDAIIVACSNMQRAYPAISIELQEALGAVGFAYDMNAACASASFGLHTAYTLIQSGAANCVLMVNPEIYTGHLNFSDRRSHFIFGDGCSAAIVERKDTCQSENAYRILGAQLKTQFSNNIRNDFGFMNRCEKTDHHEKDKLFKQNGKKVKEEVVPMASKHIQEHLSKLSIKTDVLKRLWLHQANIHMNKSIGENVFNRALDQKELPLILEEYGNTGASGALIAFHDYHKDLEPGDIGVLCSFGAGYTVGSIVLEKLS